jgi:hypothetical protein
MLDTLLRTNSTAIDQLAQRAVIAGLRDNPEYEERANTIIEGWLWTQRIEATEDNIYTVREQFDYYVNECLLQLT